jgi:ATP-dependent helicase/nuclease subunit A
MVVGDPKQSIYRFRRADVETYNDVLKAVQNHSGHDAFVLSENFRSSPAVMRWVHGVFGSLFARRPEGWAEPSTCREEEPEAGAFPSVTALFVKIQEGDKADEKRKREAEAVAAHVKGLLSEKGRRVWDRPTRRMRDLRAGDIAILFKDLTNNEEPYEEALRSLGVPHQVVGGKKFYRRPEIVALANLLTALDSPADEAGVVAVLRGPVFGFSDGVLATHRLAHGTFRYLEEQGLTSGSGLAEAFAFLRDLHEKTSRRPVSESVRALLSETPLLAVTLAEPYGEQRAANLYKVADRAAALESTEALTFRSFSHWLRQRRDEETMEGEAPGPESTGDRVLLMTIHQAKGLEFPVVVVPNANATPKPGTFLVHRTLGTVDVKKADMETAGFAAACEDEKAALRAESLRLLYVAATRAQDALVFPWSGPLDEDAFLFPATCDWNWTTEDLGKMKTLSCGASVCVLCPSEFPAGRDPFSFRMAYDPSEAEGAEAVAWAEKFAEVEARRRLETQKHLAVVRRRTAHHADFSAEARPGDGAIPEAGLRRVAFEGGQGSKDGLGFGRLVHRLLELSGRAETHSSRLSGWVRSLGMSKARVEEAFRAVESFESSDLGRRIRASHDVFRELPITLGREGEIRDGRIDLAFVEDGQWVLVDYKTDRDPERLFEQYQTQILFYADLLRETTGKPVKEAVLIYLRTDGTAAIEKKII